MASIVVRALKLELPEGTSMRFTDVGASHWAKENIAIVAAHGISNGMNNEQYEPDQPMTREQFAVMIVKGLKMKTVNNVVPFTDRSSISSWAAESVNILVSLGLLNGYPNGSFQPKKEITRAEAEIILTRLEQQGYISLE